MVTITKSFTGGFGSLSGLLKNVSKAPTPVTPTQTPVKSTSLVTTAPAKTASSVPISTPTVAQLDKIVVSPIPAPTVAQLDKLVASSGVSSPASTSSKPTKLQIVSSYSAPAGTVVNVATVDALLKQNIDKGDPNLVTGEALKSLEQKGKIDPSLGNLLSSNAAVAKGAAALGVTKTEIS